MKRLKEGLSADSRLFLRSLLLCEEKKKRLPRKDAEVAKKEGKKRSPREDAENAEGRRKERTMDEHG